MVYVRSLEVYAVFFQFFDGIIEAYFYGKLHPEDVLVEGVGLPQNGVGSNRDPPKKRWKHSCEVKNSASL